MGKNICINLDDGEKLFRIGKAFACKTRIDILKLLCSYRLNVNEISEKMSIPPSSAAAHVKVLEEAELIKSELMPAVRGSMKVCYKAVDDVAVSISSDSVEENVDVINMPIGNYVDYHVEPTCGLVSKTGPIGDEDEPRCFYHPDRGQAELLWLGKGYVEYRFPNNLFQNYKEKTVEISMEICSEDHEYNLDCKSDITLWINELEAGKWCCPSDYGGRRGRLNPDWWPDKNTQFGMLKTWRLTEEGTFLDGELISDRKLSEYCLSEGKYISVRIGIKEDAEHIGGINLFGECFGDYPQNIKMCIYH